MNELRPNILFIQVDQLTASALGCYGNPISDTPNISQLGLNGVVFESAYSNFPLCAPSRFSMLSGQLPSTIGAYDNGAEFPSAIPTFAHYLRALGYQTCLAGKMHFVGADQLHGFEQRLTTDIYPADFGWTGDWTEVKQRHSNDISTFTKAGVCIRNPQMEYDEEVTHRTIRKVYDLSRGYDPRPFFLMASFSHPHDPYQCTQQHWDRYNHEQVSMPKLSAMDVKPDPYSVRLRCQYGLDRFEPSAGQIRIARHAYLGSLSYIDDQVGRILGALKETGMDENTMTVFSSDHGDMLGERGLWYKKSFFEDSVRVPLIFNAPALSPKRIPGPVSLVDLLPTFVDLGSDKQDCPIVEEIEGTSLCPEILKSVKPRERVVYSENLAEGALEPVLMVRKDQYKFVYSGMDPDQLFDLKNDPLELDNLADSDEHTGIHQQLTELTKQKWDMGELSERVKLSQKRRLFLGPILGSNASVDWDYVPGDQAGDHVLRGDRSYNDWAYNDVVGLRKP